MPKSPEDEAGQSDLGGRNRPLDEQLKKLVKAEQRLYLSQRELGRQLRRVDALNRFALGAGATRDPTEILELAMAVLFEVYPLEQALGLLADADGALVPAAVGAASGREQASQQRLAALQARGPIEVEVPFEPLIASSVELAERGDGAAPLLAALEGLFEAAGGASPAASTVMIVPLPGPHASSRSVLVLRRLGRQVSFHEELPTQDSLAFVNLVGQQVAVALSNAHLVASLKQSYSDLERTQRELVTRERLAAIGELAAVVAHEVRNPLGVIFNSLSTLKRIARPEETVAPLLGIVHEEVIRLNRIVSDLIDFARPATPSMRLQPLTSIAAEAVAFARADAEPRGVALEIEGDDEASATVDEHLLRQALLNLIANAVQASERGSVVHVRVARSEEGAVIEVEDRGGGIAEADLGRIFEPFFTTRATGTGLGLTVVVRFAEAHGGEVDVRSTEQGTVFALRLSS